MKITRQIVAEQIGSYLRRKLSLEQLVDWSERQIMDGEPESDVVRDAIARLGLADVRAFGLTWEDCQRILQSLGYSARIEIAAAG